MDAQALQYTILRLLESDHDRRRAGPALMRDLQIAAATGAELSEVHQELEALESQELVSLVRNGGKYTVRLTYHRAKLRLLGGRLCCFQCVPPRNAELTVGGLLDAFNRHDGSSFASAYARDAVVYDARYGEPLRGREKIRRDIEAVFERYPELAAAAERVLQQDRGVAFEASFTGASRSFSALLIAELDDAGHIEHERRYFQLT